MRMGAGGASAHFLRVDKAADAQLTQQKSQRNGQKNGQRGICLDEMRELYTCKHNLSRFLR